MRDAGKQPHGEREAVAVELGVEIVEQHQRLAGVGRQQLGQAGEQRKYEQFSLSRRGGTPRGGALEEDFDPIALRPDEQLAAFALARGRRGERLRDRSGAREGDRGRRLIGHPQRGEVGAFAVQELAGDGFEALCELGAFRRAAGDERRQEVVPGLEVSAAPAGCEQMALLRQNALQLEVLGESRWTEEECRAVEKTPSACCRSCGELALALGPGDDRQQCEVLGERRRFLLQGEAPSLCREGETQVPEAVALDLRADEEVVSAARTALTERRRAEALAGGGEVDRFEEAALARAVRAVNQIEARVRPPIGRGERTEAGELEPAKCRGLGAQMRIGMMTQR